MDRYTTEICHNEGGEVTLVTLGYADDVGPVTGSVEGIQRTVARWSEMFKVNGMKIKPREM